MREKVWVLIIVIEDVLSVGSHVRNLHVFFKNARIFELM